MFSSQLWQLIKVQLLYVNPQNTKKARDNGKTGRQLFQALIQQYITVGVIFTVMFGFLLLTINFAHHPAMFTSMVGLFSIIGLSQSVNTINNVFFESKDLKDYLPLPFNQWAIYLAKFSVIAMTILPTALPVWLLFMITGVQSGHPIPFGFTVGTLLFVVYYILLFLVCTIVVFSFAQTKFFQRHEKMMTFVLNVVSMLAMGVAILVINTTDDQLGMAGAIPGLLQMQQILINPLGKTSLITMAVMVIGIICLILVMQKWLLPRMLVIDASAGKPVRRKPRRPHRNGGMDRQFIRYNLGLLKNPTLLTQSFSMTMFPLFFIFVSLFLNGGISLANLTAKYAGAMFVAGVGVSFMTINTGSVISVFISLERENLSFIRSLPIDFKHYLSLKFKLIVGIQTIVLIILAVVFGIFAKMVWLNIIGLVLGVVWGNILSSAFCFTRDWQLLDLNWTNVTQLFNRGSGNFMIGIMMLGVLVAGGIVVGIYMGLLSSYPALIINPIATVLVVVASGLAVRHYLNYWRNMKIN